MAILIGTYYGFFLPAVVDEFVSYNERIQSYTGPLLIIVFQMNAIVNPFIYAWMNKDFNDAFRKILRMRVRDPITGVVAISGK